MRFFLSRRRNAGHLILDVFPIGGERGFFIEVADDGRAQAVAASLLACPELTKAIERYRDLAVSFSVDLDHAYRQSGRCKRAFDRALSLMQIGRVGCGHRALQLARKRIFGSHQ